MLETYRGFVMAQETDSNGHMNVQFYTQKFDQASGQFLSRIGFDFNELNLDNLGFAYVESTIRYIKEVMEDDPVHIESTLITIGNKVVTMRHEMKNSLNSSKSSDCTMKWVLFDKKSRKAVAVPKKLRLRLQAFLSQLDDEE